MRHYIAPAQITPVINMVPNAQGSFDPAGAQPGGGTQFLTVTPTLVTSDATTVTIGAGQKAFVQNWDDAAVYVKCGAGASSSSATYLLSAGTAANDGLGGSVMIDDFVGIVSFAAASGSPRVNVALFS